MSAAREVLLTKFHQNGWDFALATTLALVIAGCSVGFAWLSGQLILAISEATSDRVYEVAWTLLGVAIARGAMQYLRTAKSEAIVQSLAHTIRGALFSRVLHAAPSRRLHPDELAHRVGPDVQRVEAMLHALIANLPLQLLTGVCVGVYAFVLDWPAALMAGATASILLIAIAALTRANRKAHRDAWDRQAVLASLTANTARGSQTLQTFRATAWAQQRFEDASQAALRTMMRAARLRGMTGPTVTIGAILAALAVVLSVAARYQAGHLTPSDAGTIAVALLLFLRPIQAGAMAAPTISAGLAALDRLNEVLGLDQHSHCSANVTEVGQPKPLSLEHATVLGDDSEPILDGISLELAPGDVTAVVGASGAGKTTLLRALTGQVTLFQGDLRFGDNPVDPNAALFAVVPDHPVFFRANVRDNVVLGQPQDPERLDHALRDAGLSEWVRGLPEGLDTRIDRAGEEFSAGERQRLSIARALYRRAPILALDEPIAHLDPSTASAMIETLRKVLGGRTVLMITHDLALATLADRIIVLDRGKVTAEGVTADVRQSDAFACVFREPSAAPADLTQRAAS